VVHPFHTSFPDNLRPIRKHADRNHCLLLCCSHHHLDCLPFPNYGHQNAPLVHLFGNLSLFLLHRAQIKQFFYRATIAQRSKALIDCPKHDTKHKDMACYDSNIAFQKQHGIIHVLSIEVVAHL